MKPPPPPSQPNEAPRHSGGVFLFVRFRTTVASLRNGPNLDHCLTAKTKTPPEGRGFSLKI